MNVLLYMSVVWLYMWMYEVGSLVASVVGDAQCTLIYNVLFYMFVTV